MKFELNPGTYVVAVSGGVDSIALLHQLSGLPKTEYKFIVAHFDHGIRDDSYLDRRLVQAAAKTYRLPFVYHMGKLGPRSSEARARAARYAFLHQVRQASGAQAVITAHHQGDVLETAILNIVRGTGRKGFSSLRSTDIVKRPLLDVPKSSLQSYALDNQLVWREDSTNADQRYLRNYLRSQVIPRMSESQRDQFISLINRMHVINDEIDRQLLAQLHLQPGVDVIDRHYFTMLPHAVGLEFLAAWLRQHNVHDFDRKTLLRLSLAAKTYQLGKQADINHAYSLQISKDNLALLPRDR